jgi:signal transduction histidine kinase
MNTQSLPISTISSGSPKLRGGLLLLARSLWLILVMIAVGLFLVGIPLRADALREQYEPKIGALFLPDPSGNLLIFPWLDFPANQAGILDGDVLLAVNGKPIQSLPDAQENFTKDLIRIGPAGTPIHLQVRTGNHTPRDYTIYLGGEDAIALARLGLSKDSIANYVIVTELIFALMCLGIAGVIFLRKSDDWLALLASLSFILLLLGGSENTILIYVNRPVWRPVLDLWFALMLFDLVLFFCLFPDGRFVARWTRIVPVIGLVWIIAQWLNPLLYPWKTSFQKGFGMVVVWLSIGLLVQFYRYRVHSNAIQRQQTKWVVSGMIASSLGLLGLVYNTAFPGVKLPSGMPTVLFDLIGYPVIQLFMLFLPLTIAVAILRYHLWDIDIIINRTLVYGALTISVIGVYVILVGSLGTTIQARGNLLISILATGLVAVLVQPLRDRLQRGVNRMMYGERDDPVTVLSRLGQRLEGTLAPDAVLPSLVETVAQTLKLPYVAIETIDQQSGSSAGDASASIGVSVPTIAYGEPQSNVIRLPLIYQSETIGQLIVAPRAPGEPLSPMDRHLLDNIAHQAGMAVHAVSLTADLQRSRQRLVTAREEERRRLRRDLHDGLGPNLASQGLKLAAARQLLENDPASALTLLDQVMAQNKSTVEEIRRLVYNLRPPALDELGLVAAIRDYIAGMDGKSTLQIEIVEPPGGLPPLSAAVEVAAYRIVLEALTNVIRHSHARHCAIRFFMDQKESVPSLQVEIQDDGIGFPDTLRAGVGTRSMRERAEELGGTCIIESRKGKGTRICINVPLMAE